jgi:hypothetical protein
MPNTSTIPDELPGDAKGNKIQSASHLQFEDGAATPLVSGSAANTCSPSSAFHLTVPANAMVCNFRVVLATGAPTLVLYGDNENLDGSASGKGFMLGDLSCDIKYECIGESDIYIKVDGGTATIYFSFAMAGTK